MRNWNGAVERKKGYVVNKKIFCKKSRTDCAKLKRFTSHICSAAYRWKAVAAKNEEQNIRKGIKMEPINKGVGHMYFPGFVMIDIKSDLSHCL